MSSYSDFAAVYDTLMRDVDYKKRAEYIVKLFKKYGKTPTLLLDLACGTGAFSSRFSEMGIETIGVDMSEEMLSVARENAYDNGDTTLYLCQKAEELDLFGTIDGAVCLMDSVNHLTDKRTLEKAFKRVSLFMEKDGLFIFDVNTVYKHKCVLGNNTTVFEQDGVFCAWQNEYVEKTDTVNIRLDFFAENGEGYDRYTEEFAERAYTVEYLTKLLKKCDFEVLCVFDDMTEKPPKDNSERIFFVAKKIHQTNAEAVI